MKKLPNLIIGDIAINPPIIQGGMGVKISASSLAAAVSNTGALGVIASVGLGHDEDVPVIGFEKTCEMALRYEIKKARNLTHNPIGINIMEVLTNYSNLVKTSIEEQVDVIIVGAGLPLDLPSYLRNSCTKIIPIVSSGRTADIICKVWSRRYKYLPDAFIVEGPLAGGHLGFSRDSLVNLEKFKLENLVSEVIDVVKKYNSLNNKKPQIIAAGGIFDGKDIARILKLGANGVQMGTRFVCTLECDASEKYKNAYLNAKREDIVIINSPVGLPGRVIRNDLVKRIEKGKKIRFKCPYKCLKTCNPDSVDYCIAKVLRNAAEGNLKQGFCMCGANAYRVKEILPVRDLMSSLVDETLYELQKR